MDSKLIDYVENSNRKGLLLYGNFGKTYTAILIAKNMLDKEKINMIYFISNSEERINWIQDCCLKLNLLKYETLNYFNRDIRAEYNFNSSCVIIDESQDFIFNIKQNKKIFKFWIDIKNSDCKVLATCRSPLVENTKEWILLQKLLDPSSLPSITSGNTINKSILKKLNPLDNIRNIIYYYNDLRQTQRSVLHQPSGPEGCLASEIVRCKMSPFQFQIYHNMYMKELEVIDKYSKKREKPQKYYTAKNHIESRKLSNVCYFPKWENKADIPDDEYEVRTILDENDNECHVKIKGWIMKNDDELTLGIISSKIIELFVNISKSAKINIIYSSFVKKHGLTLINTLCNRYNFNCINLTDVSLSENEVLDNLDCVNNYSIEENDILFVLIDPFITKFLINSNTFISNKKDIDINLHILDECQYKTFLQIIQNKYTEYRYHSVSERGDIKCIDEILHKKELDKQKDIDLLIHTIQSKTIF